ncbi:hypothetical protein BZL35_00141 [Candidatus Pandoraea novymonadis]|uniref:Uncharacterized protein n=1 Tax=Candidatus Pandoraea novymonadis TaxID=1808959 RepID=A0ABX5FFV5_9BURK|nr:hypothetical protein BZL35_00141 [Candidatus Pandoraea novymonadis]
MGFDAEDTACVFSDIYRHFLVDFQFLHSIALKYRSL